MDGIQRLITGENERHVIKVKYFKVQSWYSRTVFLDLTIHLETGLFGFSTAVICDKADGR